MGYVTLLAQPFFCLLDFGSRERLCMNRVRSLLSMRCMLPGYSFELRPNMPIRRALAAILLVLYSLQHFKPSLSQELI